MSDPKIAKVIDLMAALKESLKGVCVICAGRGWTTGRIHLEHIPCKDCGGTGRVGSREDVRP